MSRSVDRTLATLAAVLLLPPLTVLFAGNGGPPEGPLPPTAAAVPHRAPPPAPVVGPDLPPDFYGKLPEPFPGPEAPEGVKRLALLYNGCVVGDISPCG